MGQYAIAWRIEFYDNYLISTDNVNQYSNVVTSDNLDVKIQYYDIYIFNICEAKLFTFHKAQDEI